LILNQVQDMVQDDGLKLTRENLRFAQNDKLKE